MTSQSTLRELNYKIHEAYETFRSKPEEEAQRQRVLQRIEELIRQRYNDAKLTLFGSSCNGFGFARSDLDVCLTFSRSEDGKDLCLKDMVWAIAKKLRYFPSELTRPLALTHPKVPIIRFFHVPTELQVDISLYNTLALENTRLLRAYCDIDQRVQQLGCYIKNFAKRKDIADASKGGLSSYAFILMMIFYLQQCRPPVVPVLQELYPEGDTKPEFLVDSWNTWFFEDTSFLDEVWTGFGKNDWSVAELWAGLLQFYATEFDFTKDVVCVRRKAPLTMSEKGWASNLAIEDPFNLDRNLGRSVNPTKNALIMCSLLDEWRVLVASKIKIPFAWCEDKAVSHHVTDNQPGTSGCKPRRSHGPCDEDSPEPRASSVDGRESRATDSRIAGAGAVCNSTAKAAERGGSREQHRGQQRLQSGPPQGRHPGPLVPPPQSAASIPQPAVSQVQLQATPLGRGRGRKSSQPRPGEVAPDCPFAQRGTLPMPLPNFPRVNGQANGQSVRFRSLPVPRGPVSRVCLLG